MLQRDYKFPLKCPFAEKDECKSLGGKWDSEGKIWYVPPGLDLMKFKKWWSMSDHPELAANESKNQEESVTTTTPDGKGSNSAIPSAGLGIGPGIQSDPKPFARKVDEPLGSRDDFKKDRSSWKKSNI